MGKGWVREDRGGRDACVQYALALVCETESRRGGRGREVLGRRRVVEWKLKRRKAFLPEQLCPHRIDCCTVIEWTDATRAVATSMGDCRRKKVGSGGRSEWRVGPGAVR